MKEFWLWVIVVTLIIVLLGFSLLNTFHVGKQLRRTEAILQRAEQLEKEKKREKDRIDPPDAE